MMVRTLSLLTLSAVASVASAAPGNTTPADTSTASTADIRKTVHAAVPYCAGGLEQFLPGQYYFCAAVREFGQGHDRMARARLRDAAYWASKPAQYVLGLTYYNGDDVTAVNRPLGVAWLALSAERHDPRFEPSFAQGFASLSPTEREQANVYWRDLREKYADATAGRRAQRVYKNEMRNLQAASMFGGSVFIDGMTPGDIGGDNGTAAGMGQSAFGAERIIQKSADDLFHGMEGTVTVGEGQMNLVPVGSIPTTPSGNAK